MAKDPKRAYRRLPWLIVAVTGLALVIGGLSLLFIQKRLVADAGESLAWAAQDIAEKLDWFLFERSGDVQVLAQAPVFRGGDSDAMGKYLIAVQQASTAYVWLAVTDRQGRIVASSEPSSIGSDRRHAGWFQVARDGRTVVLGDVEPLDEVRGGMDVVAFTVPIVSQQEQFIGVVTARVTLTRLEEILTRTLQSFQRGKAIHGSIAYQFLTHEGVAFVDSDLWHKGGVNLLKLGLPSARLSESGQPGFVEEEHLRLHVPVVTGYARTMGIGAFRGLDWRVLVSADRAEILAPVAEVAWRYTLAGLIILGPMAGLLLWTARRVRMESEQTSAQLDRLKGLNRVSHALQQVEHVREPGFSLPEFLQLVIETAVQLTGARYGAVGQFDESGEQLVRFLTTGMDDTTKGRIGGLPRGRGLLGCLAQEGDGFRLKDLTHHPVFSGFPPDHPQMRSFLGVSIRAHDRLFGRIYLAEKHGADEFSEIDEQVIAALAAEAGVAIENGFFLSQIRTAELLYRTTMIALPVSVVRLDLHGIIRFANPCFYGLIGQNEAAIVGRTMASVLHSEGQLNEIGEMLRSVRAHDKPVTRDVNWINPTGERRTLRLCAAGLQPVADVVLIIEDITERKYAEKVLQRSRDFYMNLFDEFPALIWRAGSDGKCDYFNSAWLEFTGRALAQELGDGWAEGVHPDDVERCVTTYRDAFQACRPFEMEYRLRRHDGAYRWIMDVGRPFHDLDGTFAGYIGSCHDFTERRQAEALLRQSEVNLRQAQHIARLGSWDWNLTTNELAWSDQISRMFGVATQQIECAYEAFLRSVHPDDRAFVACSVEEALSNDRPYNIDHRILLPDGMERVVHEQAEVIRDAEGRPVRMIGTAQDVTEARRAEAALRTKTAQLEAMTGAMTGFLEHENWQKASAKLLTEALRQTGSQYGFIGVLREGGVLRVLVHEGMTWDGTIDQVFYEKAIQTHDEVGYLEFADFNNLFGRVITGGDAVIANDPATDPRSGGLPPGHPPLHAFLGVPIHHHGVDIVGMFGLANRPGGYTEAELAQVLVLAQTAGILYDSAHRKERETVLEQERAQAATALRESEAQFRQLAETITQVFWMTTPDKARMLYVSPAYEEIWGATRESLYASPRSWADAIHPDDRGRVVEAARDKQVSGEYHEEYRILRPDGSVRWILDRAFPVRDESGVVHRIIGVAEDLTDRKQMEEQLRHSQKMEAVGQLAGAIAHDFNNLLTVISGYCEMMLLTLPRDDPQFDSVREIHRAGERAAALTHQLLAFSRKQVAQPKRVDLNVVIAGVKAILQRLLGEPIELAIRPATDLGCVRADVGQIEQVLLNLAINARDAMPEGGRLTIETTNFVPGETGGHRHVHRHPGSYVLLTVGDNGVGMDEATQARIFEPFFTTKPKGKGTGLGLSTVHGIVEQSGGHIEVHSQSGRGTTFTICLPRVDGVSDDVYSGSRPDKVQEGDETILLVEDEDAVRSLVGDILRENGYTVLEACHGDAALRVSREHAGSIHLLLTDVRMPGMSGRQLGQRLTPTRPDMKVLFMSGYTDNVTCYQNVLEEGGVFLQKPFTPHVLTKKVREALTSSKQGDGL